MASVANATTMWLEADPGTGFAQNAEITVNIGETAELQVWAIFDAAPSDGVGDGAGNAVMSAMSYGLEARAWTGSLDPLDFGAQVDSFIQQNAALAAIGMQFTSTTDLSLPDLDGFSRFFDATGTPNAWVIGTDGWVAGGAASLIDSVVAIGVLDNSADGPLRVGMSGTNRPAPAWVEMYSDDGVTGSDVVPAFPEFDQGSTLAKTNSVLINVTPEPGSLALLALGGLAAIRRRS
jgi:hypothetical protein